MPQLTRVAWTEGMHLAQHHFQVQTRFAEDSIAFTLRQCQPHAYGFTALSIDEASIPRGVVSLHSASGLLPDGLAFHMPAADALPESLHIAKSWPSGADRVTIWLAVPQLQRSGGNVASASDDARNVSARFHVTAVTRSDDFTGGDEREVRLCAKNLRLTAAPALDDVIAMPLLRLRRTPTGEIARDTTHIPPILHLAASSTLSLRLRRLIDVLRAKADALAPDAEQSSALVNYAARELPAFWMIHTLRSAIPALTHLLQSPRTHPEQLYLELSRLAGALCSFGLTAQADGLPRYQHDDVASWCDELELHIRRHLELIVPDGCVVLPFTAATDVLFTTRVDDPRARTAARWFLGVAADVADASLRRMVPELVKVSEASRVLGLVRDAVPGLTLEHVPTPPAALAADPHMQYFRVERRATGPHAASRMHEVGVYVPAMIAGARLELRILLDD
jgi:type VI secretion system protein ImpJ